MNAAVRMQEKAWDHLKDQTVELKEDKAKISDDIQHLNKKMKFMEDRSAIYFKGEPVVDRQLLMEMKEHDVPKSVARLTQEGEKKVLEYCNQWVSTDLKFVSAKQGLKDRIYYTPKMRAKTIEKREKDKKKAYHDPCQVRHDKSNDKERGERYHDELYLEAYTPKDMRRAVVD